MANRPKPLPSQAELLALLRYEPETGKLFWRERSIEMFPDERAWRSWNTKHANKEAFTAPTTGGYRQGQIHAEVYLAHRVIFKMVTGEEPPEIDHDRGERSNNMWERLRPVNRGENQKNQKRRVDNTSGTTGVHWDSRRRRWVASIKSTGKCILIGRFDDKKRAVKARKRAEREYGFHPNHGRAA